MAGLLDGFGDFLKSPEGQGLLSGVMGYAANARQGTPWNNLGRGGLAGLTGYAGALDRQAQAAEAEQMKKYRDAQLENFKRQQSAQDAAAARQAKTDSALANPYKMEGGSGGFSLQTDANGLPIYDTNMNFSPVVAPKKVLDVNNLLANHVSPKQIQEIAELDNLGKTEVARTIEVQRPDGVYTVSFDKYGNQKGEPQKKFTAPTEVGQGDRKTFVDFAAGGKPVLSVPINQSPDSKAANALGWANHNVSRERLNFDKAGGAEAVKQSRPEWKDGQWVMPPKDMKPGETRAVNPVVSTKDAKDALMIIGEAEKYIDQATGSGVGTGLDWVGRAVGYSTKGDTAIGQLKALEGVLVSKMPKMSGPQSDKDVALYKQMAAEIGDPMMPNSRKKAALQVVKQIQQKYAEQGQGGASGSWGQGQFKILSVE